MLDIGCGRGLLLREFQVRGWEVQGTELSEPAARFARELLGLPVQIGLVEELNYPDAGFDAVVLWHVLEHVSDPGVMLAEIRRLLRPGGVLLVGVPNLASWEARLARDKWFHLDVPRHLTHLTGDSLRRALARAGFEVCAVSGFAPEYDCFSFVQSLLNRAGVRQNLLYNMLRGRGAKVLAEGSHGALHALATLALGPCFGLLSLPATTLAGLLGSGATITVIARKK